MIQIRKGSERGYFKNEWLESYHSFSFSSYHDPKFMGFRDLRVINDDIVQPAQGFGTHPHRDMEIITFVLDGALEHKDSMGNGEVIKPYEVQRMSAGTGILHSEFNHSKTNLVRLLQVWILPKKKDIQPSYEQKHFSKEERKNKLVLLASGEGKDNSVSFNQDAEIFGSWLNGNLSHTPSCEYVYIHCHGGELEVAGNILHDGDAVFVEKEKRLTLNGKNAEFLLFELS